MDTRRTPLATRSRIFFALIACTALALTFAIIGGAQASQEVPRAAHAGGSRFGGKIVHPGLVVARGNGNVSGYVSEDFVTAHPQVFAKRFGMSQDQAKQILAGVGASQEARPTEMSGAVVQPADHSGCNLAVCITVQGYKLLVDYWSTTATGDFGCIYPLYWRDDVIKKVGNYICPDPGSDFGVYVNVRGGGPWEYPNGTILCNSWKGESKVPGYPCATVHD
ncbi:MAG: hypothetical protein QM747_17830 [Nocardioides sp.]